MPTNFIQVILPLRLEWEPFYSTDAPVAVGDRVAVPLSGREYIGVVSATGVTPTVPPASVKAVRSVETGLEKVLPEEILLWRQMASYYLCTTGEIYRAAHSPGATADEEKAAAWAAEQQRRLAAKEAELEKVRPGTKKEAALREGIARLREQLGRGDSIGGMAILPENLPDAPEAGLVRQALAGGKTVLLECADDARRTAIYLALAQETLAAGRSILWLLPDNLSVHLAEPAIQAAIPDAMFYDGTRTLPARRKIAARVRASGGYLAVGTRSALLLPHHGLGLVIVENEQDKAYKQESPAPRYNGRDTALMLARIQSAAAVIGSATPSLDSLYNASTGRHTRISIPSATPPGAVMLIDTSAEKRKRGMDGELSFKLLDAIGQTLSQGGRALVLLPRKGFDPEGQIAAAVAAKFPGDGAPVCSHLGAVSGGDFPGVRLICLLFGDALLSGDDFRADERALQTLRRLQAKADLVIQAKSTEHPVFQALVNGQDGTAALLAERSAFGYPPLSRMVRIVIHDKAPKRLALLSGRLASALSALGNGFIAGPYAPARDEDGTVRHIRILLPRDRFLQGRKKAILDTVNAIIKDSKYPGHITIDVDPAG